MFGICVIQAISKTIVRFDLTKYKVGEILFKIIKVIDFKVMVDFL